jgi:hypothetical protein
VVGLAAGPDFVRGLQTSGISLMIAGIATVIVPHTVGILVGHRIFKVRPGFFSASAPELALPRRRSLPFRKPPRARSRRLAMAFPMRSEMCFWHYGVLSSLGCYPISATVLRAMNAPSICGGKPASESR